MASAVLVHMPLPVPAAEDLLRQFRLRRYLRTLTLVCKRTAHVNQRTTLMAKGDGSATRPEGGGALAP